MKSELVKYYLEVGIIQTAPRLTGKHNKINREFNHQTKCCRMNPMNSIL